MPVVLVLEGRVVAGRQQAMEAFLRETRPYYESIGDVAMRFMWHTEDSHRFREEFTYQTDQAYVLDDERVRNDAEMQSYVQRWRALVDGDIRVSVWREIALHSEDTS